MNGEEQDQNALFNKVVPIDMSMMMNILIELLNCKPTHCIPLPEFRIDQLIKIAFKKITSVSEKKVLEPLCATYCLCLYFGLSTEYNRSCTFRFLSLMQSLIPETFVNMHMFGKNKIQMPDIALVLEKNESIEVEYKLEIFTNAFTLAKSICRDLYSLSKVVFRVGKRGAHSSMAYTPDEKKKQLKYTECIQPYSVYFMCCFAYCHVTTVLYSANNLNIYPGMLETLVLMVLSTTATECANMIENANAVSSGAAGGSGADSNANAANPAPTADGQAVAGSTEEKADAVKAVVIVLVKLGFEVLIATAHKLAVFVAHVVCDERRLQEVRVEIVMHFCIYILTVLFHFL